jgi:hypothetical protein
VISVSRSAAAVAVTTAEPKTPNISATALITKIREFQRVLIIATYLSLDLAGEPRSE